MPMRATYTWLYVQVVWPLFWQELVKLRTPLDAGHSDDAGDDLPVIPEALGVAHAGVEDCRRLSIRHPYPEVTSLRQVHVC